MAISSCFERTLIYRIVSYRMVPHYEIGTVKAKYVVKNGTRSSFCQHYGSEMSDMSSSIVMVSARWTCDLKVTASRSRSLHRPICRPFMAAHLISHFREVLAKHIPVSKRNSSRHGRIVGRERSETERPICFRTNLNGDI